MTEVCYTEQRNWVKCSWGPWLQILFSTVLARIYLAVEVLKANSSHQVYTPEKSYSASALYLFPDSFKCQGSRRGWGAPQARDWQICWGRQKLHHCPAINWAAAAGGVKQSPPFEGRLPQTAKTVLSLTLVTGEAGGLCNNDHQNIILGCFLGQKNLWSFYSSVKSRLN